MLRIWPALLLTPALLLWPFSRKDRPPPHGLIEPAYFYCPKCRSLHGGIFGKGPLRFFDGPNRKTCVHDWQKIPRKEFKDLAVKLYAVDWGTQPWFWRREEEAAKAKAWVKAHGGTAESAWVNGEERVVGMSLHDLPVADEDLRQLHGLMVPLRRLDLSHTPVTDGGLRWLGRFRGLQGLLLRDTAVSDEGLEHLSGMSKLQTLDLTGTRVTDAGVRRFQQELPKVKVTR